jgi:hypothetical protein
MTLALTFLVIANVCPEHASYASGNVILLAGLLLGTFQGVLGLLRLPTSLKSNL